MSSAGRVDTARSQAQVTRAWLLAALGFLVLCGLLVYLNRAFVNAPAHQRDVAAHVAGDLQ